MTGSRSGIEQNDINSYKEIIFEETDFPLFWLNCLFIYLVFIFLYIYIYISFFFGGGGSAHNLQVSRIY